jgi:hypothetical protein
MNPTSTAASCDPSPPSSMEGIGVLCEHCYGLTIYCHYCGGIEPQPPIDSLEPRPYFNLESPSNCFDNSWLSSFGDDSTGRYTGQFEPTSSLSLSMIDWDSHLSTENPPVAATMRLENISCDQAPETGTIIMATFW